MIPRSDSPLPTYAEFCEATIADLRTGTYRVCATASARVYHKPFDGSAKDWTFTGHRGLLVFGRDWQSDDESNISGSSNDETEKYWFRLLDDSKTTWIFRTSVRLDYQMDRPFFHVFPGKVGILLIFFSAYFKSVPSESHVWLPF